MNVDVVLLPDQLQPRHLSGRAVVVFDVLRATTSIAAALSAGVVGVRVFGSTDLAKHAANSFPEPRLLCGEHECLPPSGFDLGNSPAMFTR